MPTVTIHSEHQIAMALVRDQLIKVSRMSVPEMERSDGAPGGPVWFLHIELPTTQPGLKDRLLDALSAIYAAAGAHTTPIHFELDHGDGKAPVQASTRDPRYSMLDFLLRQGPYGGLPTR